MSKPDTAPTSQVSIAPGVRIIHGVPGAPAVDVYLGDRLAAAGLSYKSASAYAPLTATSTSARVTAAGSTTDLLSPFPLAFPAPGVYTVIAAGTADGDISTLVLTDDSVFPAANRARIRFVHAATAPTVDIHVNDRIAVSDLPSGRATGAYMQWDAGTYRITIHQTGPGTSLLGPVPLELKSGGVYTAVLLGIAADRSLNLQLYRDR